MATTQIVHVNLDTLVTAHEAQLDTTHQRKAWEWLAEQSAFTFIGDALVVDSATWSHTRYHVTPETCTCPSRKGCWHKHAAATVQAARTEDARYDAMAESALWQATYDAADTPYHAIAHHEATETVRAARAERKAKAYADVLELFN